ncbi:MAG: hypothetical protein ACJ8F7_05245 [Gemmataceae bacterium]
MLFHPRPRWDVLAVSIAYSFPQTGVILVKIAEDLPEDRQMGVRTVVVAVALRRGISLSDEGTDRNDADLAGKRVPLWITAGALTSLLAAAAAFVWRSR